MNTEVDMFSTSPHEPARPDPLFPASALVPVAEVGGGYRPMTNVPGVLRPYSATLAVVPIECGKHDTTATRYTVQQATKTTDDSNPITDSVSMPHTDS